MKKKTITAILTIMLMVYIFAVPTTLADDTLDVVAWASPENVSDGQSSTIFIEVTNNTGAEVTLSAYAIDNEFFQFGSGTVLKSGETLPIEYEYTVSFGQNDSIGIPIQVNHDGAGGSVVASFAQHIYFFREANEISVQFNVIPDKTTINSGEKVSFRIYCENMGNTQMKDFYVRVNGEDHQYFDLAPNEYMDVIYEYSYTKDTTVTFGYAFSYEENGDWLWYVQDPADAIKIAVIQPSSQSQTEPTQAPTDDMMDDIQKTENDTDNDDMKNDDNQNTDIVEGNATALPDANTQTYGETVGLSTESILLIVVVGLLVVLIAVILIVVVSKKKK
ncbi:MAG: hypothetical protein AB1Z23_06475 [Eubacteriales bacterium]